MNVLHGKLFDRIDLGLFKLPMRQRLIATWRRGAYSVGLLPILHPFVFLHSELYPYASQLIAIILRPKDLFPWISNNSYCNTLA